MEAKADWMSANPIIVEFAPHVAAPDAVTLRLSPYVLANGTITELGVLLICCNSSGQEKETVRCIVAPEDRDRFVEWIEEAQAWLAPVLNEHAIETRRRHVPPGPQHFSLSCRRPS